MHRSTGAAILVAASLSCSGAVVAQQPDTTARRQQRTLDSLTAVLREVSARLDSVARAGVGAPAAAAAPASGARGVYMNVSFVGLSDAGWSTARDIPVLQGGDHDPKVRGFTVPNAELALDGAVDPWVKGFANIVTKLDEQGATGIELEEMFFLTTSLPFNLQLKAGQFLTEFGRQNGQHPHAWAFADQPLVMTRMFGPDGLRSQGFRVSWLLPTSFYTEASLAVQNSVGGTAFSFRSEESSQIHGGQPVSREVRTAGDLLYVPRLSTSFDIASNQTVVLGASAALGPNNSGTDASTQIFGGDVYWKWKSPYAQQGFPFVSIQAEAMTRRYDAAARLAEDHTTTLPAEKLTDEGMYGQVLWGIRPLLVASLRGEFVGGNTTAVVTDQRADRYRVSPNITWYPSEFSKFRLQYNYDHRQGFGVDHSLWIQFEFLLGAHAAHKF